MCDGGWRKPQYSRIIVLSAFFSNIILPLSLSFKAPGAPASALITETVVTLAMGIMLYRRRGIDLLPRLSDLQEQVASLSFFAHRNCERVGG